MRLRCILLLAPLLGACEPSAMPLFVQLRTDLVPGLEVSTARTRATTGPGGVVLDEARAGLSSADRLLDGLRIAELSVPGPTVQLDVDLLDEAGLVVVTRRVAVTLDGPTSVTVIVSRTCRGVSCPSAADPSATACLGGRCVRPECTPETPAACPAAQCSDDPDCPTGPDCTTPLCFEGSCSLQPHSGACEAAEICDPDVGCVAFASDAGPSDRDAGQDAGGVDAAMTMLVDSGLSPADGGAAVVCTTVCPGTCEGSTCVIEDADDAACPDGVPCEIRCMGDPSCAGTLRCGDGDCIVDCVAPGSCMGVVDCSRAASCDIRCGGTGSCQRVVCGAGDCTLDCAGPDGCTELVCGGATNIIDCPGPDSCDTIDCIRSRMATITCGGPRTCSGALTCAGTMCSIDCIFGDCAMVDCSAACQCDVSCTPSSCIPAATCPSGCRSGNGCRAGSTGCGC